MSKKLLALILCLSMFIAPVLTGCGNKGDNEDAADASTTTSRDPMTLSLWLPTNEATTKESVEMVEAALNLVLAEKNTKIELHAINEAEYEDVISEKINSIDEVKKAAEEAAEAERLQLIQYAKDCVLPSERKKTNTSDKKEPAKTEASDNNSKPAKDGEVVYPAVADDQLDIFLIKGYDTYIDYIDRELLKPMNEEIPVAAPKIYSYIYPSFFDIARVDGDLYGIPNAHALGEYEFLLVNKRLVSEYSYSPAELETFVDCENFIIDIATQNLEGVTPLLGEVNVANMVYFGNDEGNWSLLCQQIGEGISANSNHPPKKTLDDLEYISTLKAMKHIQTIEGAVGDGIVDEGEEFAVGVVKGDITLRDKYAEDYYVYTHGVPVADVDDVFESVFCISEYTKNPTRAMEVINFINTNEEFRTILQYGVQDYHWRLNTSGDEPVIDIIDSTYKMNIVDTGNVFLTYPDAGVPKSYWKNDMLQNKESSANPYVGFTKDVYTIKDGNEKMLETLNNISGAFYKELMAASYEDFDATVNSLKKRLHESFKGLEAYIASEPPAKVEDFSEDDQKALAEIFVKTYENYAKSK